jgi:hypothetical protein
MVCFDDSLSSSPTISPTVLPVFRYPLARLLLPRTSNHSGTAINPEDSRCCMQNYRKPFQGHFPLKHPSPGWVEMPRVPRDCRALTRQCGELTRRWLCYCRGKGVKCRASFNSSRRPFLTKVQTGPRFSTPNTSSVLFKPV